MKTSILFCAVLVSATTAQANDSAFSGVSGTPKPMRGEHLSIAMQSEKIVISADPEGYSTDVEFVFRNSGGKTSVQMGFPEHSYNEGPDLKGKSAFLRFATWVDGRKTPAKRIVIKQEEPEIEAYWLKTVEFAPKQTRRVRVSYRSPWGGDTSWGTHRALVYDFTGKNWKRKVERSDLEIRIKSPGLWLGLPKFDNQAFAMEFEQTPKTGVAREAIFRKTWRNWQAQGTFTFGLSDVLPFWMQDRIALGSAMLSAEMLRKSHTFRIGAVPDELPTGATSAPAFRRHGVDYISLSYLAQRLDVFAGDLEKYRKVRPKVELKWDAKTKTTTLLAGNRTLSFPRGAFIEGTQLRPILLRGEYGDATYVPFRPVVENLGLMFATDVVNRVFDLKRGSWTGQ